jgi:integration host factor subunit alpha
LILKKNFTRKNITNKVYQILGFSNNISSRIIDDFFETTIDILMKFKKIKISSFGTFEVVSKNERIGRNPKTKMEAKISARNVVKFKLSNIIKNKINS